MTFCITENITWLAHRINNFKEIGSDCISDWSYCIGSRDLGGTIVSDATTTAAINAPLKNVSGLPHRKLIDTLQVA